MVTGIFIGYSEDNLKKEHFTREIVFYQLTAKTNDNVRFPFDKDDLIFYNKVYREFGYSHHIRVKDCICI